MTAIRPLLAMFICLTWVAVSEAVAKSPKEQQESLRGLKGVFVLVEAVDKDIEKLGLTRDQLYSDVELRLRKAGIPDPKTEGMAEDIIKGGTFPFLYVRVAAHKDASGLFAFSIEVDFKQSVTLTRDPTIKALGTTWESGSVGTVGASNLQMIREAVSNHVDKFIRDFLSMNPTRRTS